MYSIRELEKEQLLTIYRENIDKHFPKDEIKPLKKIEHMWDMGIYYGLAMYDMSKSKEEKVNEEKEDLCKEIDIQIQKKEFNKEQTNLIGYAFFIKDLESNLILLDYFAIIEEYRAKGMGSAFLQEMKKFVNSYRAILLETEDVDKARTVEEAELRKKRDCFYERNGVRKTDVRSEVYGVHYAIWNYPVKEEVSFLECRESIKRIYKAIVSEEKYKKFIRI